MLGLVKKLKDGNTGEYAFPVTVWDAVYVDEHETLKEKIKKTEALLGSRNSTYTIDLKRFRITQGSFGQPPYSAEEWEAGYTNLLGFNAALKFAANNGYTHVVVPRGVYSFCYTNLNGGAEIYEMENTSIRMRSNLVWDLNGSTFEVMYDSHTKNPYDKSPVEVPAWKLSGALISVEECSNAHIINGTIIGDIPNRSFDDGGSGFNSERGMEQTYGIKIDKGSIFCSTEYLDVSMFMGDGITIGSNPSDQNKRVIDSNPAHIPGYVEASGIITAKAGAYVSAAYDIDSASYKEIQMRSGGGHVRIVPILNRYFQYVFLNSAGVVVRRTNSSYLQTVTVPSAATKVRIQLLNEAVGLSSLDKYYMITTPQPSFVEISNCKIHDNHRGGISGGADYTLIRSNKIYHNGMDSSLEVPVFPDSTRYAVNFEDSYANYLFVEGNSIYSGFNGVLLGVYHAKVEGNIFNNIGGVVVYNNHHSLIQGNVFQNSNPLKLESSQEEQERNIYFNTNTVECDQISLTASGLTYIKMSDNQISVDELSIRENIELVNNRIKSLSGAKHTNYTELLVDCRKNVNNLYENFIDGSGFAYRTSFGKKAGSNYLNRSNTYRNVMFNSVVLDNHIEFADSEFYNCQITVQMKDITRNSSLKFYNCYLQNTGIDTSSNYLNDDITSNVNVEVELYGSRLHFTDSFSQDTFVKIIENTKNAGLLGRRYQLNIYDSEIRSSITLKDHYLLKNVYNLSDPDTEAVFIQDSVIDVSDLARFFFLRDQVNQLILKRCVYKGFDSIPLPGQTLFVEDDRYISEPVRGKFKAGQMAYNRNVVPGGSVGWITAGGYANNVSWTTLTKYFIGNQINAGGHIYAAQNSGTSAGTIPAFPAVLGSSVEDKAGAVNWVSKTYGLHELILPAVPNGYFYECTTAGTSGTIEPVWPTTADSTVTSGTAVFKARRIITWKQVGEKAVFSTWGEISSS